MATRKRNTLLFALVGLVAVLIVLAVVQSQKKPKGEEVAAEPVKTRTIRETVAASGKVFPVTEVKISSDVSGEVVELFVEEGDSVVVGQILARVDPDAYESQVEQGTAAVNGAKAQMANARSQVETFKAQRDQIEAQVVNAREIHKRNEQLRKDGVISQADLEASQTTLRSLEANLRSADANVRASQEGVKASEFSVKSAEASLKVLQTSLRRTTIYAPMSGIVSLLGVEKGERVVGTIQMTGTEMMRIADLRKMEVQVEVSENDITRVTIGDDVDVEVDAYLGRKFKGKVSQIANSASNTASIGGASISLTTDQVTNFIVTIDILTESYQDLVDGGKTYPFRPGMSASVEINTETLENVLSVPIQSVATREKEEEGKKKTMPREGEEGESESIAKEVTEDDLLEVVFLVEGDSVRMAQVTTGIQDDSYIQILTGVNDGEMVITGPYAALSRKLKNGDRVRVVDEDELFKKED